MNTLDDYKSRRSAKVAIIGAACRFPGGSDSPETFFANLLKGVTCVSDVPEERWSADKFFNERDVAGKAYVGRGHFLDDYDYKSFDADFFGLSPREVEFIDPQQRLLLELAWEAMDNAGLDVETLAGSSTGVFVGGFTVDHLLNQLGAGARDAIGTHSAAGATLTMLSNRISYAFDFCGPSLSIDTACSSSLVAFAQGVSAILTKQCDMALVGGANFILRPEYMVAMSKGRFLAKDGRSKSFDARADGYGRGEGGGVVVLKAYDAALRDGDDIIAVVDGAGINQDGRTSGITVPNPEAQRALMVRVLAESGRDAAEIDYVEAHGTGTSVGDPRETRAIADVYGQGGQCVVGSVKANIGHLEAAAGIASIIKSVMMLRHNQVPPVAGLEEINPSIPPEVIVPREPLVLNREDAQRKVAINSFGYGGTNAHVILSSADAEPFHPGEAVRPDASALVLPLSARDPKALRARAEQFTELLEASDDAVLDDILFTAGERRTHMAHRLAVWGDNREDLLAALRDFGADEEPFAGVEGSRPFHGNGRIAFVYTGMGPQWWGMGRELLRENHVFRETLEEADALFTRVAGFSILAEMTRDEADSQIKRTEYAQPANLMIQIGLTAALRAEGIIADAVVGHSVGEVASAWASGMLSLEQALLVSRERSRTQAKTAGTGGMLALGLSAEDAAEVIRPHGDLVSLAAVNSPRSVTVAGDRDALEAIRIEADARRVFARMLEVEVPYHSPLMEALKPELREKLASLRPERPDTTLYSTVTGGLVDGPDARGYDAEYWCDNVRNPVYFADAIGAMLDDGYRLFVEVGPHPVLRRSIEEISSARNVETRIASTLWMNRPETKSLRRSVCEVYANGGRIDWAARTPSGRLRPLPAYPWQRQPLWREAPGQARDRLESQRAPLAAENGGSDLNLRRLNYLFDHVVDGAPIMPAAGYLEALCEEARRRWPDAPGLSLRDVRIERALVLDHERSLRLVAQFDPTGHRAELYSRDDGAPGEPVLHASAFLHPDGARPTPSRAPSLADTNSVESVDPAQLYADLSRLALQYGPAFQPITALRRDMARGVAEAELTRPESAGEPADAYVLHPALLDGCFQTALTLVDASEGAYLPVSLVALEVYAPLPENILCTTHIAARTASEIVCDFELTDRNGRSLARIKGLTCRSLHGRGKIDRFPAGDYQRVWNRLAEPAPAAARCDRLLIIAEAGEPLADELETCAKKRALPYNRCTWAEVAASPSLDQAERILGLAAAGLESDTDVTGEEAISDMLFAIQAMAAEDRPLPLRIVTRNAHAAIEGDKIIPAQAAVAGFVRVVRNELALLDAASIDIDDASGTSLADAILAEVLADQRIDEIALRGADRHAATLVASGILQAPEIAQIELSADTAIEFSRNGPAYSVSLMPEPALPDDRYELRVERFGLQLDREDDPVGIIGIVTRAGSRARCFGVGQRVAGIVPRRIASRLIVDDANCVLEAVENASLRSALLAPVNARAAALARLCAPWSGARALIVDGVFGDALAREVRAMGAMTTRVAANLSDWEGPVDERGFDLIAGPLSDWSRRIGFFALASSGRLVDLGQDPSPFAVPAHCGRLVRMHNDLAVLREDQGYREELRRTLDGSAPIAEVGPIVGSAELLQAESGGPIGQDWFELDLVDDKRAIAVETADVPSLDRNGTYLVTGGFSGLGRAVALWLAANGAGRIALAGRRGLYTPGAPDLLDQLRELGARGEAHAVDVADPQAVARLLRELHRTDAPLRGIYHAAGVIDDQPVRDLTPAQIQRVMGPKAGGAWALHVATTMMGIELQQFVLFSSIANLVGNSRQANYCAANGFLDGLAHLRRSRGMPALSVNFGAIEGTGMLQADERVGQHLTQIGLAPLDVNVALRGLGRALARGVPQVAIAEKIAWEKWAAYESVGGASPAFTALVEESRAAQAGDASLVQQLHAALAGMDDAEALEILRGLIADVVASGLKTSADRLKPEQTFDSFGVDSLMTTEIQIQLDHTLGVNYSVVELLGSTTIAKLADKALLDIRANASGVELAA